jgi:hypothetical protein
MITVFAALFAIYTKSSLSAGLAGLSISLSLTVTKNSKLRISRERSIKDLCYFRFQKT